MKNIYCFLMMLLVAMVSTASLKCDPLVRDIIHDVMKILNHTFEDFPVAEPSNGTPLCVPGFFCLAEKSLDPVKNSGIPGLNRLHRQMKEYAIKKNQTECTLSNSEYGIKHLLEDIETCAKHELTDPDGHVTIHCKL